MNAIRKQSLRVRLTTFFVLMSIIPAAVLGVAALRLFSDNLETNEIRGNQHTLEYLDYRLSQVIGDIHKAVLLVAYDNNVRAYFQTSENRTADELAAISQMARRQLISLQQREEADSVMLISNNKRALVYTKATFARVMEAEQVDYQVLDEAHFRTHAAWGKPRIEKGHPVMPYERIVLNPKDGAENARLVVYYPETVFSNLLMRYEQTNTVHFYVLDLEGTVMSCTDKELVGADAANSFGFHMDTLKEKYGSFHAGGYLCSYRINASDGFILLERTPLEVFSVISKPIMKLLIGISGICIFVCLALGALVSHSMTKPLYELIDRVSNDPTSASHALSIKHRDEFALLSDQYDVVIKRLEASIADYYEEQRKKKEAEVRALEFQINPHFLYNTLSTIIWLIDDGDSERAIEITQELSAFFRISISKGKEFISLRDELEHVRLYVDIQKSRYADLISVKYEVPDELLGFYTPKLILQPLVENSIIHGMQDKRAGCHICIRAGRDGDNIILTVEDDGKTATPETIREMNRFLEDRAGADVGRDYGIGISNVHDRIRMSFGEGYGLSYRRKDDHTIAVICIRAMNGGEEVVSHSDR